MSILWTQQWLGRSRNCATFLRIVDSTCKNFFCPCALFCVVKFSRGSKEDDTMSEGLALQGEKGPSGRLVDVEAEKGIFFQSLLFCSDIWGLQHPHRLNRSQNKQCFFRFCSCMHRISKASSLLKSLSPSWETFIDKTCSTRFLQPTKNFRRFPAFCKLITRCSTIGFEKSVDIENVPNVVCGFCNGGRKNF